MNSVYEKEKLPAHEKCSNCNRTYKDESNSNIYCKVYINPNYWWSGDRYCPLADREKMMPSDVVNMAIGSGLVISDGKFRVYKNAKYSSRKLLITELKRNKTLYTEMKKQLGISDGDAEQGKTRVGQQKQKKHRG